MTTLSANIREYRGRKVDLLAFDGVKASGEALLTQTLVMPGESGAAIAGIEKLVQRFLLELLTEMGSLAYRPGRGCMFMLEARAGFWRTPGDVASSFASSVVTITDNLVSDEEPGDPDDERFKSATMESVSLVQDLVVLRVVLMSMAGESRVVLFPLRVANT